MRVSINKLTGKMIESQGGGETHLDPKIDDVVYAEANLETLRQNAINAGHLEEDVEVKYVTDAEFAAIMEAEKPIIDPQDAINEAMIQAKIRELAVDVLKDEELLPVGFKG